MAKTWFASLLRDGFALTVNGMNPEFTPLAREQLRQKQAAAEFDGGIEEAVEHIMSGFSELSCHPDVVEGIQALEGLGFRLVTLSNGSANVARRLLTDAGIAAASRPSCRSNMPGSRSPPGVPTPTRLNTAGSRLQTR
ncbi:MAG: hypothetical protein ABJA74_14945, partial [Lapillicoccus sp.]